MNDNLTYAEALEKLLTQHTVKVHFNVTTSFKGGEPRDRFVTYRVTQYTLREFMASVAAGNTIINIPCWRRDPLTKEWIEAFETLNLDNICTIEWPSAAAEQMHLVMSAEIESMIDDAFGNCEAAEGDE